MERAVIGAAALAVVAGLVGVPAAAGVLAWSAALLAVGSLVVNPARWQLVPAHVVVAGGLLGTVLDPPAAVRIGAAVAALVLLALSTVLVMGMPQPRLPRPDGPFGVGSVTATTHRTEPGVAQRRTLLVKIWYPALTSGGEVGEALWSEFRESPGIPALLRLLTGYLRQVRTHTVPGARFDPAAAATPVVLYNHGLISIAAENTLLVECLASHGYVVVGVRHLEQQAELRAVDRENTRNGAENGPAARIREINRRLAGALPRREKAELAQELYRIHVGMGTVVARRAADSRHVLDHLPVLLGAIPAATGIPSDRVAAVGLSVGGAVSTELGKADDRCAGVVNIDGGLYGPHTDDPVTRPYLMMYSELNSGGNDLARQAATAEFGAGDPQHAGTQVLPDGRHPPGRGRRSPVRAHHHLRSDPVRAGRLLAHRARPNSGRIA